MSSFGVVVGPVRVVEHSLITAPHGDREQRRSSTAVYSLTPNIALLEPVQHHLKKKKNWEKDVNLELSIGTSWKSNKSRSRLRNWHEGDREHGSTWEREVGVGVVKGGQPRLKKEFFFKFVINFYKKLYLGEPFLHVPAKVEKAFVDFGVWKDVLKKNNEKFIAKKPAMPGQPQFQSRRTGVDLFSHFMWSPVGGGGRICSNFCVFVNKTRNLISGYRCCFLNDI
jgi:hypothetical protein